ncbi:Arm DNA-binding domain-containing protein [Cypionkella sp.]|nr:Arm DNA-binding domain-containing protein [Cypionkella sp.]MDZ4393876.1 Arm DNA-binding domain-containing protein [Cypionkella sp.]
MAKIELTDHYIKRLSVDVRTDIADAREPGLTLRITPSGSKSWAVRCRSADGTSQRVTLGQYPDISLKDARSRAALAKADIRATEGNLNQVRREAA